jgi:hypothetical protein
VSVDWRGVVTSACLPLCGMAERAVRLVDHVLPDVPVRQWVLSLPYQLRYRLAWDHDLCRRVTTVFLGLRSRGVPGAPGCAGATAAREPDSLLWGARGPRGVAAGGRAAPAVRSGSRGSRSHERGVCDRHAGHRAVSGTRSVLGRSDETDVRVSMSWTVRGAAAGCASSRSSNRPRPSVESSGTSVSRRTCPSPAPPVRRRCSSRRVRRRPTSTNRASERRLLAADIPEVCPKRLRRLAAGFQAAGSRRRAAPHGQGGPLPAPPACRHVTPVSRTNHGRTSGVTGRYGLRGYGMMRVP